MQHICSVISIHGQLPLVWSTPYFYIHQNTLNSFLPPQKSSAGLAHQLLVGQLSHSKFILPMLVRDETRSWGSTAESWSPSRSLRNPLRSQGRHCWGGIYLRLRRLPLVVISCTKDSKDTEASSQLLLQNAGILYLQNMHLAFINS